MDTQEAGRLARQLDGRLSDAERAELIGNLNADDQLLGQMADATVVQFEMESAGVTLDAAPTPDALRLQPRHYPETSRRSARRWVLPPAMMRPPGETLEGARVLDEHEDESVAVLLWASIRDVMVWALVRDPDAPEKLAGLFVADAGSRRRALLSAAVVEPTLEVSLITLAGLVDKPEVVNPEIASLACIDISRWARDHGAMGTAVAFAQAAAVAVPDDPGPAVAVGALQRLAARSAHELGRAATWLRLGIALARRRSDWIRYAEAFVELGAINAQLGRPAEAVEYYERAVRVSRRNGHAPVRAAALHGLMRLAIDAGDLGLAESSGRAALRNYGRGHARIPDVMHDLGHLLVLRGDHSRGASILGKQLVARTTPRERALTLAILARAMAGMGADHRLHYQEYWSAAWSLIHRPGSDGENHARALLQLAAAAAALKDWIRVDQAVNAQAKDKRHADARVRARLEELAVSGRVSPDGAP